jgi:hypothetical protein
MHGSSRAQIIVREIENKTLPGIDARSFAGLTSKAAVLAATFACGMLAQPETADAVPAFARQTGYYCSTCHTAQPELTPFGRQFKLNGYTSGGTRCGDVRKIFGNYDSNNQEWSGANAAGWILPSFNHFNKDLPDKPAPHIGYNNILDFSDASVFFAGQIYCGLGVFSQFSYTSTGGPTGGPGIFLDNTELRYSDKASIGGHDVVWGVLGNNNPTMQDVWNTVPAWQYPWVPVDVVLGPPGTMIEGTFGQRAAGAGAYVWVNNMFYAELSAYKSFDANALKATGFSPTDGEPRIDGVAPYWRLAIEKTWNENSFMVGTYGMYADQVPTVAGTGLAAAPGLTDKFTDVAFDAQYQYIGPLHAVTVRANYIIENQKLDATLASRGADKADQWLNSFNVSASYIYDRHISFTADYFNIQGSSDAGVYGANRVSRPNTDGVSFDLAYIPYPYGGPNLWPWLNARVGILYTHFNNYNGSSSNYNADGSPLRNAKDNDQVFLYSWIDF